MLILLTAQRRPLLAILVALFISISAQTLMPVAHATAATQGARPTDNKHDQPRTASNSTAPESGSNEDIQAISYGEEIPFSDENGTWQLRFQCFEEYGVVNWHFNFAPSVRSIAAGWATEDGLRWWRNGAEQPKGSPHFVPLDYTLHGTMSRVHVGDILDYQDYITFPHNLGGGGTASITFAGSIRLVY
jgi:hypothetical protein